MCRFIVYHGPAITMSSLVTEPEHAMLQLAMKALLCATPINADGFGISWYHSEIAVPGLFKDVTPAWNNPNLTHITRAIKSPCFFAHVRAASTGGVNYPNCHPFVYKNISFMHNGTVPHFKHIKRSLLSRVSDRAYHLIQGTTDSETMFALFITNFERLLGMDPEEESKESKVHLAQEFSATDSLEAYDYTTTKEDNTHNITQALRTTLRQVHYLSLQHEYKTGLQPKPEDEPSESEVDGAANTAPLLPTQATGRLNLAVTDGQTTCSSRYVTSAPSTAHSLYYGTGSRLECNGQLCQVLNASAGITPPASPLLVAKKKERVVVVSSEPLASGFNCKEVPVNHMAVSGPNAFFAIESCI